MTALRVHEENREQTALELHYTIEHFAESYAEAGQAMIRMRDGQFYKDLPGHHYKTFEEYIKEVREMTIRHSRRLIRASLIHECLTKNGGTQCVPRLAPSFKQCLTLDNGKGAVLMSNRDTPREGGGIIKQPIQVKNSDELNKLWSGICNKYAEYTAKWKEANPDKPPRKFSATFVNENLPAKFRNDALIKARTSKVYERLLIKINRVVEMIEKYDLQSLDGQRKLAITEEWTKDDRAQFSDAIRELEQLASGANEAVKRLRV